MKAFSFRIIPIVFIAFFSFGALAAQAQAPLEPAQLPPRTIFYLIWRGTPSPDARKANSLLALWDDPDFAPVRSALAASVLRDSNQNSSGQKLSADEIKEFASLLENSFTLGYVGEPTPHAASNAAASAESRARAWNGMFFVYDRSGKEALIAKAILKLRSQQKEPPQISQVTLGGVPALKSESKNGTTYWADTGKYAVSASERRVMEEILARLGGKSASVSSLAQSAAYQEAQPANRGGVLEFFLRVPDLKEFANSANSKPGDFKVAPLLDAIRLDAVHSVSGHLSFEGSRTHVQAAILGDTTPGTLFDLWATGKPSPASLAFAPAESISYTYAQVNFLGIYDLVKRVGRAVFPQGQQGNADIIDTMAQARLGMPLTDALGLFSGEFASLQTSPSMDAAKQVYFLGIRKKPETLRLIRTLFSDQLTSERNEGDVTFMKISLGGKQGAAGVAQWNFFNLAVTSDMILGASRTETLREALASHAHATTSAGLASVEQFQASRSQYPEKLTGLSYFDFQKIDWPGLKNYWLAEARKAQGAKSAALAKKSPGSDLSPAALDWLEQVDPQVFARHLRYSSSVSWKDAKGMHWDQWIE
jgi:hypothetical protein